MKITVNNYKYFRTISDIIPEPMLFPWEYVINNMPTDLKNFFNKLFNINDSVERDSFLFQYVSKSKDLLISNVVEMYLDNYGLKLYGNENNNFYSLEYLGIEGLLHIIDKRFTLKWTKLYNTLSFEYNPIKPYDMRVVEDSTDKMNADTNIDRSSESEFFENSKSVLINEKTENKLHGFNSTNPVPSDETDRQSNSQDENNNSSSSSQNMSTNYDRTIEKDSVITKQGNIGNTPQQELIEKERDVWEFQLWDIIFNDLNTVLSCQKYI